MNMSHHQYLMGELKKDIAASEWLKEAALKLDSRDVVDVINELEFLLHMFNHKLNEAKCPNPKGWNEGQGDD